MRIRLWGGLWTNSARFLATRARKAPVNVSNQTTPLQHTLLGRLMVYLNREEANGAQQPHYTVGELAAAIGRVNEKHEPHKALRALDIECCLKLHTIDTGNALKLLNAFMSVTPDQITSYNFYKTVIDIVSKTFRKLSSKNEILQFVFYLGLEKQNLLHRQILGAFVGRMTTEFLDSLTVEEICIICNSTYRTKTRIKRAEFLEKVKSTINNNLCLFDDAALLVTLLKTIKQNHYQDDDLLSTISCAVFFNRTSRNYSFTAMTHILSLYSAASYYDEPLLEHFVERCLGELRATDMRAKTVYLTRQPRAKDLASFLQSVASLGYNRLDERDINQVFLPRVRTRLELGDYRRRPELLVETVLYLWMLDSRPRAVDLIDHVLSPHVHEFFQRNPLAKGRPEYNLLLTCLRLEDPDRLQWCRAEPVGTPLFSLATQLKLRPDLARVHEELDTLKAEYGIGNFEIGYQIPFLNILGITGYYANTKELAVNVEVLDEYTCVRTKECCPTGHMQLKMRLLNRLDVPVITICDREVDIGLADLLREELIALP